MAQDEPQEQDKPPSNNFSAFNISFVFPKPNFINSWLFKGKLR